MLPAAGRQPVCLWAATVRQRLVCAR
jgi:hypothetical protein